MKWVYRGAARPAVESAAGAVGLRMVLCCFQRKQAPQASLTVVPVIGLVKITRAEIESLGAIRKSERCQITPEAGMSAGTGGSRQRCKHQSTRQETQGAKPTDLCHAPGRHDADELVEVLVVLSHCIVEGVGQCLCRRSSAIRSSG